MMSIGRIRNLLLFCDIVISDLFRENVTHEYKRGTVSYDKKRDGKTKGSRETGRRRDDGKRCSRNLRTIYKTDAKDQKRSENIWSGSANSWKQEKKAKKCSGG